MLYRKIQDTIYNYLKDNHDRILIVSGARQIGKSYIISYVAHQLFRNVVEINLIEDFEKDRLFYEARTTEDMYLTLSAVYGDKLGSYDDTIVFLDEIQQYPHLLTMLKFLNHDKRYRFVASGSLLGLSLRDTTSLPMGSIDILKMYPLDFEEFIMANGVGKLVIDTMRERFRNNQSMEVSIHNRMLDLFKKYLLVGGLPDSINAYLETRNIVLVRKVQALIHNLYATDASKYDLDHRLKIKSIYDMVPSNMENKKKRLVYKDIEGKRGKRASDYVEEIDYLSYSGITLEVKAISNPLFPLIESSQKNLLKLYLNDVGMLTGLLYRNNIKSVMSDERSVNLGSVYETVVASELKAHGYNLFYYDNKTHGEVDFLVDDYDSLSVVPLEVKSGKSYKIHSALDRFISTEDYNIKKGYVLSNQREVEVVGDIIYIPIYYVMFFNIEGSQVPPLL